MTGHLTYPDGSEGLITRWQRRRRSLHMRKGEAFPPLTADLAALATQTVMAPGPLPEGASAHAQKHHALRVEMTGQSELALLNALLISHLRKRAPAPEAAPLFRKLWADHSKALLAQLNTRWMISSAITFGDYGETEAQRSLGRELAVLFSLMKLYEFERLFSGQNPDQPFALRGKSPGPLPMEMPSFTLLQGDLDINLLAPLWQRAQATPLLGPLACHLLERLNADPGTLFARLVAMQRKKRAQREKAEAKRKT